MHHHAPRRRGTHPGCTITPRDVGAPTPDAPSRQTTPRHVHPGRTSSPVGSRTFRGSYVRPERAVRNRRHNPVLMAPSRGISGTFTPCRFAPRHKSFFWGLPIPTKSLKCQDRGILRNSSAAGLSDSHPPCRTLTGALDGSCRVLCGRVHPGPRPDAPFTFAIRPHAIRPHAPFTTNVHQLTSRAGINPAPTDFSEVHPRDHHPDAPFTLAVRPSAPFTPAIRHLTQQSAQCADRSGCESFRCPCKVRRLKRRRWAAPW